MVMAIGTAIIGAGYWGTNLIRIFHDTDGFSLNTVCDARSEALHAIQTRYPTLHYTSSIDSVLADPAIDAVVLATPPTSHFHFARTALLANKHVWVEKPLALRFAEGKELVALAATTRRTLFVDETFLYDPLIQQTRAMLVAETIGKVVHVSLERTGMGQIRRDSNVWWNSAPHDLSLLRYLFNAPILRIAASGHAFIQPRIADVAHASLELAGGCSAHLYLNWLFPEKKASLMIIGERGMLGYEGRFSQRALTHYTYRLGTVATPEALYSNRIPIERSEAVARFSGDEREPLALACTAFRDSILTGKAAPSSAAYSLVTLTVLEAGARSLAQHGVWVNIDPMEMDKG